MPEILGTAKSIYGFDPRSVGACCLWLDGADSNQMTFSSGSNMATWLDKSGQGKTMTAVGNPVFQGGSNGILLNGTSQYFSNATAVVNGTYTLFFVYNQTSSLGPLYTTGATSGSNGLLPNESGTTYFTRGDSTWYSATSVISSNARSMVETVYTSNVVGSNQFLYLNGSNIAATTQANTITYTNLLIGSRQSGGTEYLGGYIYEAIGYSAALTTAERQAVEGYLAWKWGLEEASSFPPTTIPGCILWLDGADSTTVSFSSGSTVSQWNDKSGLGNHASASTTPVNLTAPTYVASDKGILLVASNNTGIRGNLGGTYSSNSTVFVVASYISNAGTPVYNPRLFILGLQGTSNIDHFGQLLIATQTAPPTLIDYFSTSTGGYSGNYQTSIPFTYSTPFIYTVTDAINGSSSVTVNTYLNGSTSAYSSSTGVPVFTSGYSSNYNRYVIGNYNYTAAGPNSDAYNGYVYEVIVYSNVLSLTQKRQVEAYLSKKWTIPLTSAISLPTSHPGYLIAPLMRYFNPVDIPGCVIWLDGADNTTFTPTTPSSGTTITAWKDKVGQNSFTPGAIQTEAAQGTVYTVVGPTYVTGGGVFFNNPTQSFSNGQQGLGIWGSTLNSSPLYTLPTQSMTMVIASSPTSNNTLRRIAYTGSYQLGGSTLPNFSMGPEMGASEGGTLAYDFNGSAWSQFNYGSSGYNSNTGPRVDVMISAPGATQWWWTNGSLNTFNLSSNVYTSTYSNYPVSFFFIGSYTNTIDGNRSFCGNIYEILFYNTALTAAQRYQVEGYLAQKWKFASSLPSTHPFYSIPPSSPLPFTPASITGCCLWLDGTDILGSGAGLASGTAISSWNDKSGLGYSVTQATAGHRPTVSIGPNGNTVVTFTQSASTFLSNTTFGNLIGTGVATYFLVEYNMTAPSGNPGPIGYSGATLANNYGIIWQFNPASVSGGTVYNSGLQPYYTTTKYDVPFNSTSPRMDYLYIPNVGATGLVGYLNGVAPANTDSANYSGGSYAGQTFWVGQGASGVISGNICEVIVYNVALTATQRQQVEGYLAWKWGITLPTTHLYYKFMPSQLSAPAPVSSVSTSLSSSTLTATWPASIDATTGYTVALYSSSTSGGTYALVSSVTTVALTYAFTLTTTNYYKVYVTVVAGGDVSTTTQSSSTSYTTTVAVVSGWIVNLDPVNYTTASWPSTTSGNTWSVYNAPSTTSTPGGSTAVVFNGTNQFVMDQTGISTGPGNTSSFTLDIWFYAAASVTGNLVGENGSSTSSPPAGWNVTMMSLNANTIYVGFWKGSVYSLSLGSYTANTWTHACYTYSGTTVTGYVNGVSVASGTATKQYPGTGYYALSAPANPNSGYLAYTVGAYKCYGSNLSATQVKQNYNALCGRFGLSPIP